LKVLKAHPGAQPKTPPPSADKLNELTASEKVTSMSLVIRVIAFSAFALIVAIIFGAALAPRLGINEQPFIRTLFVGGTIGYVSIALQQDWRVQFNRLARLYSLIWPVVGVLALAIAERILAQIPPAAAFESFWTVLPASLLQSGHWAISLLILSRLTKPSVSKTSDASAGTDINAAKRWSYFDDVPPTKLSAPPDDNSEERRLARASSEKFNLLINNSKDIQKQYNRTKGLPAKFDILFKQRLTASLNPQADAKSIADEVLREHEKELAPYSDPVANRNLKKMWETHGNKAADEFRALMAAFGTGADPVAIFKQVAARASNSTSSTSSTLLIFAVLVILSVAAYWYLNKPSPNTSSTEMETSTEQTAAPNDIQPQSEMSTHSRRDQETSSGGKLNVHVRRWIDNSPGGRSANGIAFWDDPIVQAALDDTLGKRRRELLVRDRTVSSDMTLINSRWAGTMRCVPHDCADNNAQLFFDLVANKIETCWSETTAEGVKRAFWLSPHQAPKSIPSDACESDVAALVARYGSES
jgi:hypothetical protein